MWSKFTEYAEGIVEIVAQADATAAAAAAAAVDSDAANKDSSIATQSPPRSTSSKAAATAAAAALSGEEIWSRFASIVAPPSGAPQSQKSSRGSAADDVDGASPHMQTTTAAPRSAPPSFDQLRVAASEPTERPPQQGAAASTKNADEDEQEQYICELERALLQRKKQNEALEKKMYELEYRHEQELQLAHSRTTQLKQDMDMRVAALTRELETLRERDASDAVSAHAPDAESDAALVDKVEQLEQQLRVLNTRCSVLQATIDAVRRTDSGESPRESASADASLSSVAAASAVSVKSLIEIAQTLATALRDGGSDTFDTESLELDTHASEAVLVTQIQTLAARVNSKIHDASSLERDVTAFLARHSDTSAASAPGNVQTQLERVSERLAQSGAAATEAARVQTKLLALQDKEEEQLKKVLHLQAQVTSLQANANKADKSLQQTVTKEVELLDTLEERDATIRQLEASLKQVKASMEHLAGELKEAQSYTDELEGFCRRQKKELDTQRARVKELEGVRAQLDELEVQERETRERASEYEQGYVGLLAEIEALKAQNEEESKLLVASTEAHAASTENQTIYDLEARLSASEADKQVALQDAERLQKSVDALEDVLHQFQVDQKQQRERLLELETALTQAQEQLQHQQQAAAAAGRVRPDGSDSSDLQRVIDVLAKKTLECEQLREALENTAARYSADNEVLDKRLAAQLVVAYCETEKKGEVLQLIAGMMGFSEEQKRRVGLGFPIEGNGGGGLFSSILGFVAPPSDGSTTAATAAANIDGKSFADIWTEFLLDEAKK